MNEKYLKKIPVVVVTLFAGYVALGFVSPKPSGPMDSVAFGRLPILSGGRIKPIDTVARTSLLILRGKQTVPVSGEPGAARLSADEWLLEMLFRAEVADQCPVFEIDNPDVLGIMGLQQTSKRYYAFREVEPNLQEIATQAHQADQVKSEERSPFQSAITSLHSRVGLYQKLQATLQVPGAQDMRQRLAHFSQHVAPQLSAHLQHGRRPSGKQLEALKEAQMYAYVNGMAEFFPVPERSESGQQEWTSFGQAVLDSIGEVEIAPAALSYAALGDAWRESDTILFKKTLIEYENWLSTNLSHEVDRTRYEFFFNSFQPFYRSLVIYVVALLAACLSFLMGRKPLVQTAFNLVLLAFIVHSVGLVSRMILQGRPPVTNLYSSAIFVGWAAVLLSLLMERLYRNGVGSVAGAAIGFVTLIIAHHLAASGDTLEMMRAVLDSNFWLATHVVCITIGYSSTFLSGFLGILYLVRRAFDKRWTEAQAEELSRMAYGVVCFSLLFSFVGTMLGGIWADQSWGRFWGWDPKENGALLIVLWNAFMLHARIGKIASRNALMVMAVFGNVVTAFSWFGVNMLGIGLHSYGFMDKAFIWLVLFAIAQFAIMALGRLPARS